MYNRGSEISPTIAPHLVKLCQTAELTKDDKRLQISIKLSNAIQTLYRKNEAFPIIAALLHGKSDEHIAFQCVTDGSPHIMVLSLRTIKAKGKKEDT